MKLRYRKPSASDYSTRAARAEAKKVVLGMLADVIRDSAICGYEQAAIDADKFAERIAEWPNPKWREGAQAQLDAAAMELLDEFERRARRV
jgi:hypothetical protein